MQIKYKDKYYSYIMVFILIYMTSSYYTTVVKRIPGIVIVMSLFFAAIISVLLNRKNMGTNFNSRSFILLLFMFVASVLTCFIHGDGIYYYAIILFAVVTGYLITLSYSFNKFANAFIKVMYYISAFSLIIYFAVLIYPSIVDYAPIIGQRGESNVHNFLFAVALSGAEYNRNYGLFWEPGAFQTYLNLALIFELFINDKIRMKYIVVFVIAIATTFSTTGYIALLPILLAYILNNRIMVQKHKHTYKYYAAIIFVSCVILKLLPDNYAFLAFGKLNGLFTDSEISNFSVSVRMNSIIYPFYEFIKSPAIGVGYGKFLSMAAEKLYLMPTCTQINWLAIFGVLWGIPCNYYYLRNNLRFHCGLISKIFLAIALSLILISEDYIIIAFIYVLIFYGAGNIKSYRKGKLYESGILFKDRLFE
jgi:hypothetical protein